MKKTLFSIARRTIELISPSYKPTEWEIAQLARQLRREGVTPSNYILEMVDEGAATFCVQFEE